MYQPQRPPYIIYVNTYLNIICWYIYFPFAHENGIIKTSLFVTFFRSWGSEAAFRPCGSTLRDVCSLWRAKRGTHIPWEVVEKDQSSCGWRCFSNIFLLRMVSGWGDLTFWMSKMLPFLEHNFWRVEVVMTVTHFLSCSILRWWTACMGFTFPGLLGIKRCPFWMLPCLANGTMASENAQAGIQLPCWTVIEMNSLHQSPSACSLQSELPLFLPLVFQDIFVEERMDRSSLAIGTAWGDLGFDARWGL